MGLFDKNISFITKLLLLVKIVFVAIGSKLYRIINSLRKYNNRFSSFINTLYYAS